MHILSVSSIISLVLISHFNDNLFGFCKSSNGFSRGINLAYSTPLNSDYGLARSESPLYALKRHVKDACDELVDTCKKYPVASTLAAASIGLSAAVWCGKVPIKYVILDPSKFDVSTLPSALASLLLIPEFNGNGLLNLLSLFLTLKNLESRGGSQVALRKVFLNILFVPVFGLVFGSGLNFSSFARAITTVNCLEAPDDSVQLYGLLNVKNLHLPLILLLCDYALTLQPSAIVQGCCGIASGLCAHLINSRVFGGSQEKFQRIL